MEIWKVILLFVSAFFGGLSIFFSKKDKAHQLKLTLSLSGAYLFAITVLHLMPEVYRSDTPYIGLFILGGFLLQIVMEQFSKGIEHGHLHSDPHHRGFPLGMMISLCLHAFLEGMPLIREQQDQLVFGIALHHIPAAFALGSVLLQKKISQQAIIIALAIFASMCPLGYGLSYAIEHEPFTNFNHSLNQIMGMVIGLFLHISTTILFESSVNHKFNIKKMVAVLLGVGIALLGSL